MKLAEVKTIYEHNARDIPAMADLLAKNIRSGEYGEMRSVVAVIETADGQVEVFGWGDTGVLRTLGLLQLASSRLERMRCPEALK